jgi:hypothetical protein
MHTLREKRKGFAMKDDVRLGLFMTFILLANAPKKRSAARQDIQPAMPQLLPLTRFLQAALERAKEHELSRGGIAGPVRWLCICSRGEP